MDFNHYRVRPKQKIDLKNWEPDDTRDWKGSEKAVEELAGLTAKLEELQELLGTIRSFSPDVLSADIEHREVIARYGSNYKEPFLIIRTTKAPSLITKTK